VTQVHRAIGSTQRFQQSYHLRLSADVHGDNAASPQELVYGKNQCSVLEAFLFVCFKPNSKGILGV
jgi:hypothetical protein